VKYFLDTEFIEDGKTIDLISIGMICEDGRELYLINDDCDFAKASPWVWENVLEPMGIVVEDHEVSVFPEVDQLMVAKSDIAFDVLMFTKWHCLKERIQLPKTIDFEEKDRLYKHLLKAEITDKPEFWGYYADYDWVAFCQLFGTMMDLPKGFPMYCRDIKQLCDDLGNPRLPEEGKDEHHALADARWNEKAYDFLISLKTFNALERSK
jgi:hypothetical protein